MGQSLCCFLLYISFTLLSYNTVCCETPEEAEGVKYANKCEACKILTIELESRLQETGKTSDILEIGYSVDDVKPKKKKKYINSELRLVESLEKICDRILDYNIHKERKDSTRFAKGMSQTFKTLHNLVDKGVKVELGMPYELWDKPSVEITNMKTQCEEMVESYEPDIEKWYYELQDEVPLSKYLCEERVLKDEDFSCLREAAPQKSTRPDADETCTKNAEAEAYRAKKGDVGVLDEL